MTPLIMKPIVLSEISARDCFGLIAELEPSEIALIVPCAGGYLNFAALAFKVRAHNGLRSKSEVLISSFDAGQACFVKEWALAMAERYYQGVAASSLKKEFFNGRCLIDWSEKNGHPQLFNNCEEFHRALIGYSKYLKSSVGEGRHNNTANYALNIAMGLSVIAFPDVEYNFYIGISPIPYCKDSISHTEPPATEELDDFIYPISQMFIHLYDFINGGRRLPHSFVIGDDTVWILLGHQLLMSESVLQGSFREWGTFPWKYVRDRSLARMKEEGKDFHECVRDEMSVLDKKRSMPYPHRNYYNPGRKLMFPDSLSGRPLHALCRLAHDCFISMFALATAAILQPLQNIVWDEFSYMERGAQNQRVIKNRAHKEVNIGFEARFAKEFECYLAVRKILVGESEFKFLFGHFIYGKAPCQMPEQYPGDMLWPLKKFVFPKIAFLGMKKLRAYHLHHKRNVDGVLVSSMAGNHNIRTSLESYSTGYMEANIEEATLFFTAVGDRAREIIVSSKDISSGGCASGARDSDPMFDNGSIVPDCKNFLGCIFCRNFFVHINEADIRKIFSMRYVIEQFKLVQSSLAEFDEFWGASIVRLNLLIDKLRSLNEGAKAICNKVENEVYDTEELSPYWQRKLDMLVRIGVLR